jgi:hypothetical protein
VSRNTHLLLITSVGTVAIVSYPPQEPGQGDYAALVLGAGYGAQAAGPEVRTLLAMY